MICDAHGRGSHGEKFVTARSPRAASARRSGTASFDKFDAARIPIPPHDMAALCRFETVE